MTSTILNTKLFIPAPRPNYISRPQLINRLDGALTRKLTLVSAPAGFGKTTLLSVWVEQRDRPIAWLSLDIEDNDPTIFLRYLIAALQTISPDVGHTSLSLLQSPQPPAVEAILAALINDLSLIPQDFILLLDDYHLIGDQNVHAVIIFLLDHLPPRMHLVIISRSDPPLPLSRLRARDQLLEIRQSDLRMTQTEASDFLNNSMSLDLSQEQVEILDLRTEGWIAGLQLAALSLREIEDVDAFLKSFGGSHRFVIDYLIDEVLSQQPADLQSFLIQVSILNRFSAPLCDAITGRQDSNSVLRQLEESNLFLIQLDNQRHWYRFHHLFRDYLRTALVQKNIIPLHIEASRWFLSHGFYTEAVYHALESGDLDLIIDTISQAAPPTMEQAAFVTLNGWLDTLPDRLIRQTAVLAMYKSFILFFTQTYQVALPYAQAAEDNLSPEAPSHIRGQLMSLQAHLALCENRMNRGIKLARDALEYLDEADFFFRNLTLNVLGQILETKGDVASAAEVYRQGFNSGIQSGERLGSMVVFTNLVFSLNELGQRKEGLALCQKVDSDIGGEIVGGRPLSDGVALSWSLISYEADQLVIARQQAQRALDSLTQYGISQGISWAQYILALVHLAYSEWDDMLRLTREGFQHASRTGTGEIHGSWFKALEAQASLQRGDLDAATQWAESKGYTSQDKPHHWVERSYFTYVRILLMHNRIQDARQLLKTMETSAQKGSRLRKLITIDLLMALTDLAQDDRGSALQHLESALVYASHQDYKRAFLDEGQAILDLLPDVRHLAPQFVDDLLAITLADISPPLSADQPYEPLSERELEVLRLVSRGLSNRQIAEALFITLGTVKKHLNNIFGKLQVQNRTQAVARSRELNLLD